MNKSGGDHQNYAEDRQNKLGRLVFLTKQYYSQADAVLVDEEGHHHHVHSFLLALKIPLFRSLGKIKFVVMDGVSSDVVKLIVGMVYGHDR